MSPQRIQLRRTKGWRKPDDAVVVARPSKWGNPFVIGLTYGASGPNGEWHRSVTITDRATAVAEYRRALDMSHPYFPYGFEDMVRVELGSRDLCCWCPLDQPCHADVLLELANGLERHRGSALSWDEMGALSESGEPWRHIEDAQITGSIL